MSSQREMETAGPFQVIIDEDCQNDKIGLLTDAPSDKALYSKVNGHQILTLRLVKNKVKVFRYSIHHLITKQSPAGYCQF